MQFHITKTIKHKQKIVNEKFFYTKRFTFDFSGKQKMNPKILLYKNDFMRSSIKLGFI